MTMTHPGLPLEWLILIGIFMSITGFVALYRPLPATATSSPSWSFSRLPVLSALGRLFTKPWLLTVLRILSVSVFLTVIAAGLWGTPIPERNFATTVTWTLWWSTVVLSVLFFSSTWCAICPWDTLASWLVNNRLWGRHAEYLRSNFRVPSQLRNIGPATILFIGLTWLELGVGITTNPYATAVLSLSMVLMALTSLTIFERKAFCRYFCPVGRTVGAYSQLSPLTLGSIDNEVCSSCKTLACYHGTDTIEPCPTHLVIGRIKQNNYCTSCGACVRSCTYSNVGWKLRPIGIEAVSLGRPHMDEAWFILVLLALTSFHGVSMLPEWQQSMRQLARLIGDSGQLLSSFTITMAVVMSIPIIFYGLSTLITKQLLKSTIGYRRLFSSFAFVSLPLAFAYHLTHNLNHLLRESAGISSTFLNPLGIDTLPLSMAEKHSRHMLMLVTPDLLFILQALLMASGFWLALHILRKRSKTLQDDGIEMKSWQLWPMILYIGGITGFNLWLLSQPMTMRM